MANRSGLRVFFLHNVIAPYRLPVFEELSRRIDVEVFFCKVKTSDRKWSTSLDGYRFKRQVLGNFQLGPFFINPGLIWRLLRRRYDVYLVGDFPETAFATFLTIAFAKLYRKPLVLWSETVDHDVNYFQGLATSQKLYHRLVRGAFTALITGYRRLLLRLPNRYVALSGLAKGFLIHEGVSADKISSGIQVMPKQLLDAPTTPKAKGPYAGKKLVLYLGYYNRMKGIDGLIRAFGRLKDPGVRLAIVGTGPEEGYLRELAAADQRVTVYGYTEGSDRANFFTWADVMALPTLADCWALVVNESLHYGTPVITTNVAGASELLGDDARGLVVPPRDEDALVSALERMLGDEDLRRRMVGAIDELRADITDSRIGARPILDAILAAGGVK